MHTQWLFFGTEQEGIDYNDACNTFLNSNAEADAWMGFNGPHNWGNIWQCAPAVQWPAGDANGVDEYWAVPLMGLPLWGWELDYRFGANSAPWPLDNGMTGEELVLFNRAYWLSTIPVSAVFVEDFMPKWPEPEEDE